MKDYVLKDKMKNDIGRWLLFIFYVFVYICIKYVYVYIFKVIWFFKVFVNYVVCD